VGRATEPDLRRLTFCLLGTATPAELIEDTRISPFNIGRRIEVRDFTPAEAAPLAAGLIGGTDITARSLRSLETPRHRAEPEAKPEETARALIQRVLYWTGGHPYLTQRLCRAIVEARVTAEPEDNSPHLSVLLTLRLCAGRQDLVYAAFANWEIGVCRALRIAVMIWRPAAVSW
jgi:hypothetical protein